MANGRDEVTWRDVVVTIVVLECLLLLCRWLLAPHFSSSLHQHHMMLLDMFIVAGLVLIAMRALSWSRAWPSLDFETVHSTFTTVLLPVTGWLVGWNLLAGTVLSGWYAGLVIAAYQAGIMVLLSMATSLLVWDARRTSAN